MATEAAPPGKVRAPWTDEQVAALKAWQRGAMHPFTCPHGHGPLTATPNGWRCGRDLGCAYEQDWAHDFMAPTTTPQPGTDPLHAAIEAARNASCEHIWDLHLAGPCMECRVRAAAPHIERAALLRAADELPPSADLYADGSYPAQWLRDRAEAVGTEER